MRFDRCRAGCCKSTIYCRRLDTLGKCVRDARERKFLISELKRLGEFKAKSLRGHDGCRCNGKCNACRSKSPVSRECEKDGICTPWEAEYKSLRIQEDLLYQVLANAEKMDHLTKSLRAPVMRDLPSEAEEQARVIRRRIEANVAAQHAMMGVFCEANPGSPLCAV